MRLSMPDGYLVPPHFHPAVEHVTMLEGAFQIGIGDRFDAVKLKPLQAGSFGAIRQGCGISPSPKGGRCYSCTGSGPCG